VKPLCATEEKEALYTFQELFKGGEILCHRLSVSAVVVALQRCPSPQAPPARPITSSTRRQPPWLGKSISRDKRGLHLLYGPLGPLSDAMGSRGASLTTWTDFHSLARVLNGEAADIREKGNNT
jgi:hypothetical protein